MLPKPLYLACVRLKRYDINRGKVYDIVNYVSLLLLVQMLLNTKQMKPKCSVGNQAGEPTTSNATPSSVFGLGKYKLWKSEGPIQRANGMKDQQGYSFIHINSSQTITKDHASHRDYGYKSTSQLKIWSKTCLRDQGMKEGNKLIQSVC